MNKVAENMIGFSEIKIKNAKEENDIYAILCYPMVKYFVNIIIRNLIMNFPVIVEYIKNISIIAGTKIKALKEKNTGRKPVRVRTSLIKVPERILKLLHLITFEIDIFFVKILPFLTTM